MKKIIITKILNKNGNMKKTNMQTIPNEKDNLKKQIREKF